MVKMAPEIPEQRLDAMTREIIALKKRISKIEQQCITKSSVPIIKNKKSPNPLEMILMNQLNKMLNTHPETDDQQDSDKEYDPTSPIYDEVDETKNDVKAPSITSIQDLINLGHLYKTNSSSLSSPSLSPPPLSFSIEKTIFFFFYFYIHLLL